MSSDAPMGTGTRNATPGHIRAALKLFWYTCMAHYGDDLHRPHRRYALAALGLEPKSSFL